MGQYWIGADKAGSLYGQAAQIKTQARGQDMNLLGSAYGSYMKYASTVAASDKNVKRNTGKKADGEQALAEINALSIEDGWSYDPAKGGPDDGGVQHTGPMAGDVRAKMGEKAAPGGKVIDLVSMNGKILASMQALTRRLEHVEKAVS